MNAVRKGDQGASPEEKGCKVKIRTRTNRTMGIREDGKRRDHTADHGMQPAYHPQTRIKMERLAEDTRPDIVQEVPQSGKGIWAVSKACGYIQ